MHAANQALAAPGGFVGPFHRELLYRAALERCDGIDGVRDGLISDRVGCRAVFDPTKATFAGEPLRCADGKPGFTCLSGAQIEALLKLDGPVKLPVIMHSGETEFPGYTVLTAESASPGMAAYGWGSIAPSKQLTPTSGEYQPPVPILFWMTDQYLRYVFAQDPDYDSLGFDFANPGPLAARLTELSKLDDRDLDMSGFHRRGGKLIMLQGGDDQMISPKATAAYYAMLRSRLGGDKLDEMMRYYEVPGYGHGRSAIFLAGWDQLTALEKWVEDGVDPAEREVVTDLAGVPGRTRPLCLYPRWPQYKGQGDVNAAGSYVCAK
jgi:feruloyl esterase